MNNEENGAAAAFERREAVLTASIRAKAEGSYYRLNNEYLTEDQKTYVEGWYQLPMSVHAIAALGYAASGAPFWQAILTACAFSVPAALAMRFMLIRPLVKVGRVLYRIAPPGYLLAGAWFAYQGQWIQAGMAGAAFSGLLGMLSPAFVIMSISASDIAIKYQFAARFFGIKFPFETVRSAAERELERPLSDFQKQRLREEYAQPVQPVDS